MKPSIIKRPLQHYRPGGSVKGTEAVGEEGIGMINIPKTNEQIDQWRSVMFLYDSALKKMNTKIEILNNEFINRYDYNPIEHIKSRLKTADSIVNKLKRTGVR